MTLFDALLLAIIQGLTEFLPVSSSGHLVLAGALLGLEAEAGFIYVVLLHLASASAIAVAYWRDWWSLLRRDGRPLWGPILIGTIPAAVLGVLLQDQIEGLFRYPTVAAGCLLVTAAALLIGERAVSGTQDVENGGLGRPALVGVSQALAMLPGISRSGACLSTGLLAGYTREQSVRIAFLLGLPIICGAGGKKLLDLATGKAVAPPLDWVAAGIGCVVCALVSFGAIRLLQVVARRRGLWIFAVWCAVVGIGSLVWLTWVA